MCQKIEGQPCPISCPLINFEAVLHPELNLSRCGIIKGSVPKDVLRKRPVKIQINF